jgi:nicotinamide-nucleotide amidase
VAAVVRAEIIAVGSELLVPGRLETNATYITGKLREVGIMVTARATIADDLELLASAFRGALSRADVVIATGGLGPTEDDLTREAAAAAIGRGVRRDPALLDGLRARFARYNRVMAPVNEKQADVIEGAVVLPNARGTAAGQYVESDGRLLFLLPGPPVEMQPMFDGQVLPVLAGRAAGAVLRTRVLRIASMSGRRGAAVAPPTRPSPTRPPPSSATPATWSCTTAEPLRRGVRGASRSWRGMRERLPGRIYSEDGRDLAAVVGALFASGRDPGPGRVVHGRARGRASPSRRAQAVPERGYVTYSNRSKADLLGVDPGLIESAGAVSEEVARAMAEGARRAAGVNVALAITGVAGPGGATPDKPVGLVFLAMAGTLGERVRRAHFPGDRERIRHQASQAALEMLRRALLGLSAT